jgi:hypothetical protein
MGRNKQRIVFIRVLQFIIIGRKLNSEKEIIYPRTHCCSSDEWNKNISVMSLPFFTG